MKRRSNRHDLPTKEAFGGVIWALHSLPEFRRLMAFREDLFWMRLEWEETIHFTVVDQQEAFYNYYDPDSFAELLRRTPPTTVGEWLRDLVEVNCSRETAMRLAKIRSQVRQLLRWLA